MKFFHLADLHLGKRLNDFSLIEDQRIILNKIVSAVKEHRPDGVIIAGDVYDKSVPSAEAVGLFDDFLVSLVGLKVKVFVISGNHDSAERIAFASKIMNASGVYMSPVYNGKILPVELSDEYGKLNVYMLPFVKPAHVKRFFEDVNIENYTDAVKTVIENMDLDLSCRNVLISHQFVTGASVSGSEDDVMTVGGMDNVDANVFAPFDYVALGHIHGAQNCDSERIRYSGTPLKYSFSEINHVKSITVVELKDKSCPPLVSTIDLVPIRDLVELKGDFATLTSKEFFGGKTYDTDYVKIVLTDEEDIPDAVNKLRTVYKNLMRLEYDNTRTRAILSMEEVPDVEHKSATELFSELYVMQNGREMTAEQLEFVKGIIEKIEGVE
ncbi:MAG: exonuclease SbcCD subunit D [Clostridiales bacterium]|nr:exonuclease SbcCD subunit D [Clostridiales bacterium]